MGRLAEYKMTFLEQALVQNPTVGYFQWGASDYPYSLYPQGIPRYAVVAAFQSLAAVAKTRATLTDPVTGVVTTPNFNNQSYGNTAAGNTAPVNNVGAIIRAEDVV